MSRLPIDDVLPELLEALSTDRRALLIAPPGAGKTTRVAPALLAEGWCAEAVLLLVPRRLAARAAAEYMARALGQEPGGTIGYATRLDSRVGKTSRVVVMTHGVFLARLQADPELAGVSAVLFDEVHERSLDSDLALALTLDAAGALRPDLRILAMSATLDGERFGRLLDDPPVIQSEGRSFPLTLHHIGRDPTAKIEPQMAAAIRRALAEQDGSLLAFLPGVAEIERTALALGELPPGVVLHRLHGQVDPAAQRAALASPVPGSRKLVLASAIAETSVTLDDVRIVVDSGLARRPRYDRGAGLTRLVTERASRAATTQRAGRSARQGPGVTIRLWEEAANAALPAHDPPEIAEADLSSLLLACLQWGEADPTKLRFLDPPSAVGIAEARGRLLRLGAIDEAGGLTPHGRAIAAVPLDPRLAHMVIEASARGFGSIGAQVAALLAERGLGGNDVDLEVRWRRWQGDRSPRATAARRMAEGWRKRISFAPTARDGQTAAGQEVGGAGAVAAAIALAFPERVARRRDSGDHYASIGGRGFRLDPASPLARSEWLAVAEVAGAAAGARILSGAAIDQGEVETLFVDLIHRFSEVHFDPATNAISATIGRRLGALRLSATPNPSPSAEAVGAALLDAVRKHGLGLLPWPDSATSVRARTSFTRQHCPAIPDLSDDALLSTLDDWLPPLLAGKRRFDAIDPGQLRTVLDSLLGWDAARQVDTLAPAAFASPAGSHHAIDYAALGGPTIELRPQALYGLSVHPTVAAGRVPLILSLTSPAHRPIQTTRDLPAFWAGSWREVAKEMRGRYPRHDWPDDPAAATPSLRTKRSSARP